MSQKVIDTEIAKIQENVSALLTEKNKKLMQRNQEISDKNDQISEMTEILQSQKVKIYETEQLLKGEKLQNTVLLEKCNLQKTKFNNLIDQYSYLDNKSTTLAKSYIQLKQEYKDLHIEYNRVTEINKIFKNQMEQLNIAINNENFVIASNITKETLKMWI